MAISTHVDVIVAEGVPSSAHETRAHALDDAARTVEPVDVAPDPNRRIIVLAPTKHAGQEHADALSINPVAIVTPRSPYGARGMIADEIVEADGLSPEERDALMIEVAPTLANSGAE
jgi:hypothetical protein